MDSEVEINDNDKSIKQRSIFSDILPSLLQKIAPLIFIYALLKSIDIYNGNMYLDDSIVGIGVLFGLIFFIAGKYLEIKRQRQEKELFI
jgi:hypothetical protein